MYQNGTFIYDFPLAVCSRVVYSNFKIGKAEENIPAKIEGPDVNIAFNAQYIADVLKNTDGEECTFSMNESLQPAAIQDSDDQTFLYVVTPVRTAH